MKTEKRKEKTELMRELNRLAFLVGACPPEKTERLRAFYAKATEVQMRIAAIDTERRGERK